MRSKIKQHLDRMVGPLVDALHRRGVSADSVTIAGLVGGMMAALLVVLGFEFSGGVLFLIASSADFLDGALARRTGEHSKFGSFLDSTLDRVAEGMMFIAIAVVYARHADLVSLTITLAGLLGSQLTSYMRARAEALGVTSDAEAGCITRPERVSLLSLGLISGLLTPAIYTLALLTGVSVAQRFLQIRRSLLQNPA